MSTQTNDVDDAGGPGLEEYRRRLTDEKRFTDSTVDQYLSVARNLEEWRDGRELSLELYREWLAALEAEDYADRTINEYHGKAKEYLEYLGADFDPDRAQGDLPEQTRREIPEPLSREQIRALREAARFPEEEAFVVLGYHTGLRNSEIRALTWDDVDLENKQLQVRRRKKKDWARDTLPIYEEQVAVLEDLREWHDHDNDHLFPRSAGAEARQSIKPNYVDVGSCSGERLRAMIRRLGEEAGIERDLKPHLLRHTRAVHMIEDGESIDFVNQWLGHDKYDTTLLYARLTGEALRNAGNGDSAATFQDASQ